MSFLAGKECPGKINVLTVDHHVEKKIMYIYLLGQLERL